MVAEVLAAVREEGVEYLAESEHGGTRVHDTPSDRQLAHLAAGTRGSLEHGDVETRPAQVDGRHQSRNSRTDYSYSRGSQRPKPPDKR